MIYLASQSPRRKEILRQMGFAARVANSAYEEKPCHARHVSPPVRWVVKHAVGKVKHAKVSAGKGWVLGADTLVYCRRRVLGKPENISEAHKMLRLLSGRLHEVYTGVALRNLKTGKISSGYAKTQVFVRKLSEAQIRNYCRKVPPLDKAGAYAIQMRPKIVEKIKGSYSNVVGLPKALVRELIRLDAR